jgi:hypothetical protein
MITLLLIAVALAGLLAGMIADRRDTESVRALITK